VRQDLRERGGLLVAGQRVVGIAENRDQRGTHRRRREPGLRSRGRAQVDQPAARGKRADRGLGRLPPHRVDDKVEPAAHRLTQPGGYLVGVVAGQVSDGVRPELGGAAPSVRVAAGRGHPAGTEQPGRLDGHLADGAAGPEHQHALAHLEPAAPGQRHPGGDRGQAERRRQVVIDVVGQRHQRGILGHAELGQRAVTRLHPGVHAEPDPLTRGDPL
jgi:hypothetical protein